MTIRCSDQNSGGFSKPLFYRPNLIMGRTVAFSRRPAKHGFWPFAPCQCSVFVLFMLQLAHACLSARCHCREIRPQDQRFDRCRFPASDVFSVRPRCDCAWLCVARALAGLHADHQYRKPFQMRSLRQPWRQFLEHSAPNRVGGGRI